MSVTVFEKPGFRSWKLKEAQFLKSPVSPFTHLVFPYLDVLYLHSFLLLFCSFPLHSSLPAWDLLTYFNCIRILFFRYLYWANLACLEKEFQWSGKGKTTGMTLGLGLSLSFTSLVFCSVAFHSFSITAQVFPVSLEQF